MPLRNRLRLAALLIVPAIALGIWLLWPASVPSPIKTPQSPPPTVKTAKTVSDTTDSPAKTASATSTTPAVRPAPAAPPVSIDSILTDPDLDNLGAARALASLVKDDGQPEELRAEALKHLLNLSIDHEKELLLPLLGSSKLPDDFAVTILNEALNRPLIWQAEACLTVIARTTGKALHEQARDHLAFLTDEQHGEDLGAWKKAVATAQAKWQAGTDR